MRRTLILTLSACSMLAASAFDMVLRSVSGEQVFDSSAIDKIEMSVAGGATVYLPGVADPVIISASDFDCIAFSQANSLSSILSDEDNISISAGILTANGAVSIYDIKGAKLASSAEGKIDISGLPSGVYVISTKTSNFKIYLQ